MKRNIYNIQAFSTIWIGFLLVSFVSGAADKLSGKYFLEDSPFGAGYYINDFLPLGVILFMILGLLMALLLVKYMKERFIGLSLFIFLLFGALLVYSLRIHLQQDIYLGSSWSDPLIELTNVWFWAWMISAGLTVLTYKIQKSI